MTSSTSSERSPKIPRLDSLHHRLQHVKDANGQPTDLFNELLFFLDDPPAGTTDRWQKGADLCAGHGIAASRMAVWRLYRDHIVQWRREQNPPPPEPAPDETEIARLEAHARHLAAQRMIERLNDPSLTTAELIGIVHNQHRGRQAEVAREHLYERVTDRLRREEADRRKRREESDRRAAQAESGQRMAATILASMGRNRPSQDIRVPKPKSPDNGSPRSPTEGGEK